MTSVPATLIVPERVIVGFTVTHSATVPFPDNEPVPRIFIHFTLLFAGKSQFVPAVTLIETGPPFVPTEIGELEKLKLQTA